MSSSQIFQKTDPGRAEIARRSERVPAAVRSVLIMVNGSDTVAALASRGVPQVREHLQALLALGLIEPVPAPAAPPPPPAIPALALLPAPVHEALCRQAMARLAGHFGAGMPEVVRPLIAARTVAAFNAALDGIESRLSAHMGRKNAARELQDLRPTP